MKGWRAIALLVAMAAVFAGGIIYLFGIQFSSGGVYPEYSSLRSDPMGAKLLFEGMERIPGMTVERNFQPFEFLPASGFTLVLLGSKPGDFDAEQPYLRSIERIAERGNRVVVAFTAQPDYTPAKKDALDARWGVRIGVQADKDSYHRYYFAEAKGWSGLERLGPLLMAIEKNFGKGSVALFAGSTDFTNEALVSGDHLQLVAAALAPEAHIIFDEQHLGVSESGSVVALARRFRLTGMVLGLAFCGAMFLWRNSAAFPPRTAAVEARPLEGRTAHAGLATLLRRHIPPRELANVCWREWLNGNRGATPPERVERASAIAANATDPIAALQEIEAVLHAKGEL